VKSRTIVLSTSLMVGALIIPLTLGSVNAQSSPANSAPDNSVQNERDRNHATLTPMDQSSKPEDIDISKRIRRALVKDASLSTEAKNIKIITIDGAVTLRGPVKTDHEKAAIVATATQLAGASPVRDELEVAAH
jgi:hyperosmotically inducible periplasmic protein